MKLTDLNRHGGIGSNCLLVELGPFNLLVDAGLHPQMVGFEAVPSFKKFKGRSIDMVILTHCHLDHLGSLPLVLRDQPQTQVLMSLPTLKLARRMLLNSCQVMRRQREELDVPEYPLFTRQEAERINRNVLPMAYERPRTFHNNGEKLEVTFFRAGHVAGASGFSLVYGKRKIFFTGDVLFVPQKTLPPARFPIEGFDTLVMETTRGATRRGNKCSRKQETSRLIAYVDKIILKGGSVLIPTFALGRTQEILSLLHEARSRKRLTQCPIFCSGLGLDLANYFDEISRETGLVNFRLKVLRELKIKKLPRNMVPGHSPREPAIFVVSSGMIVENTPSYGVAAGLLSNSRNAVCFVGYCDPDTPGGRILAAEPGTEFYFEKLDYTCPVKAHIEKFDLSAHADREELLEFALAVNPRAIVLTHGDPEARTWFRNSLADLAEEVKVIDPVPLETYEI